MVLWDFMSKNVIKYLFRMVGKCKFWRLITMTVTTQGRLLILFSKSEMWFFELVLRRDFWINFALDSVQSCSVYIKILSLHFCKTQKSMQLLIAASTSLPFTPWNPTSAHLTTVLNHQPILSVFWKYISAFEIKNRSDRSWDTGKVIYQGLSTVV